MSYGREIAMLRRIVSKFFAVAIFCLRLTMNPSPGLSRFDNGRDIIGVAINGYAPFEDRKWYSLRFQIAIVGAD